MPSKAAPSYRWFAGWRLADRASQKDPADLGTAFGLDMSLDPEWTAAPSRAPGSMPLGWVRRLKERRRPGT